MVKALGGVARKEVMIGRHMSDRKKAILEAIELFNRGHFWQCHEVLEKVWLEEKGAERRALQGVILVAAAFHHYNRRNQAGMISTLRRALERLGESENVHGIDVASLRKSAIGTLRMVEEKGVNAEIQLPKITLTDPIPSPPERDP